MKNQPVVSIICSCYNHEKFVIESLDSVIHQTYPYIQLIIINDGSTDNSKAIIEEWVKQHPSVTYISNKINMGITKSVNQVLDKVQGDYIIDLAADDVLLPHCVAQQLKTFEQSIYTNLGAVYGNLEVIDEKGVFKSVFLDVDNNRKVLCPRKTGDIYSTVVSGKNYAICSVSSMTKKEVYQKLNGYDETLIYEDFDFWLRASRIYQYDFVDDIVMKKRIVSNSLGSFFSKRFNKRGFQINRCTFTIVQKAFLLNKTQEEDLALMERIRYEFMLNLKKGYINLLFLYIGLGFKTINRIIKS